MVEARTHDLVFYDGHCGLCHGTVRFLARRDADGSRFRFAPLQGEEILRHLADDVRLALPDSIALLDAGGRVLLRSDAVLHSLSRVGGGWGLLAKVLGVVPRALRDPAYDLVAKIRKRLFRRPEDVCPIVPPELRNRFLR
ncbi:MAG: thiol-disulfide oxidoreductase DCC family protein [Candidatus Eiseniibacteriota bacterium]